MTTNRSKTSRRGFLGQAAGAAALGSLVLPEYAVATEPSGDLGDYGLFLAQAEGARAAEATPSPAGKWAATEKNILGPFHRPGAPYRAKITPPLAPGKTLLIRGHVWALDNRRPLAGAVLDVWQANAEGRYDNDDPQKPPAAGVFVNRARLLTDENGYYEYETIEPGQYQIGQDVWRPRHIHYWVRARGYRELITQLYFKDDKHNATDRFIKPSLIIEVEQVKTPHGNYGQGTFDIVLPPDARQSRVGVPQEVDRGMLLDGVPKRAQR